MITIPSKYFIQNWWRNQKLCGQAKVKRIWHQKPALQQILKGLYIAREHKRKKRIEESLRDLWDNIKCTNIWVVGIPEEEEKKKDTEKIFEEVIVENSPNMGKELVNQIQEV